MNKKEFIGILITTFIVIMVWIAADIIHTKPSVPLNPNLKTVLDPINPNFDQDTLDKIKSYIPNPIVAQEALPSPESSPSPAESPSPSPSPSPAESPSPQPSPSPSPLASESPIPSVSPSEEPSPTPASSP